MKSVALMGDEATGFVLALVRGDHVVNEIKLAKLAGPGRLPPGDRSGDRSSTSAASRASSARSTPQKPIRVIADRSVAAMADFVVGANEAGFHLAGVNWGRDLPEPDVVADIRNVVAGDASPDGNGTLGIARGIEVGHVFQLGRKYAEAMDCTVLDANGKAAVPAMGCYGIGVSRIVAAAIEQNHDDAGILWPDGDGAVAGRGVHDQSEERRGRRRRRRSAVSRAATPPASTPCSTTAACARARCSPTSN